MNSTRNSLSEIVKSVESELRVRVYSHKYRIISYLFQFPDSLAGDIGRDCPSSSSTFFKSLKELHDCGIVRSSPVETESRARRYDLSEECRSFLEKRHQYISRFFKRRLNLDINQSISGLVRNTKIIEQELNISYYSSEFEIVIFLYERISARAGEVFEHSHAASTSFYATLKRIFEMGILCVESDQGDKRFKTYSLAKAARAPLDRAHGEIVHLRLL